MLMFGDAGRLTDYGQLSIIGGVRLGALKKESTCYVLFWSYHKSRRTVQSIGSAENLAVGEAIEEGKVLKVQSLSCSMLPTLSSLEIVVTDSKDLFISLST